MGYAIYIEREGFDDGADPKGVITKEQWLAALNAVEGVRISPRKDWEARNPSTGAVISISGSGAIGEVYFPPILLKGILKGTWKKVFDWDPRGRIRFKAHSDLQDPKYPVRKAAAALALNLGALLVGEEGEIYEWAGRTPQTASGPTKHTGATSSDWSKDFIRYFSQSAGISMEEANRLLHCLDECTIDTLKKKEILITGLGRFQLNKRTEKSGIDPRTGSRITIPAKNLLRFTPSHWATDRLQEKK